jgi:two-component system, response regulator PdtaR
VNPTRPAPPVQRSAAPQYQSYVALAPHDASGAAPHAGHAARVVVVEDDYLVALQMEGALTEAGFDVVGIASSCEEALALAEARTPTLALMDIRLSGKRDGIETALELFNEHGIRCIFASAHSNAEARQRAAPANPLAWLPKPYTMVSLVEVVRQAIAVLESE